MTTATPLYKSTSICTRRSSTLRATLRASSTSRFGRGQASQATRSLSSGYTTSPDGSPTHSNAKAQAHARHHIPTSQGLKLLHPRSASLESFSTQPTNLLSRPSLASSTSQSLRREAWRSFSSASSRWSTERPEPPDHLDEKERAIFDRLVDALAPTELQVEDISGGCGSMYAVAITSDKFKGLPVIKQHRLVNEILGEDIKSWHGIQLRTKAP